MKHEFANVLDLYNAVRLGFDPRGHEGAFANLSRWAMSPHDTPMLFWDEDDIYDDEGVDYPPIEDDDETLPRVAVLAGVRYFLLGGVLHSIFEVFDRQKRAVSLPAIVDAINYYREYDSFQPDP